MAEMTKEDKKVTNLSIHSAEQILEAFSSCTKNGFIASNNEGEITHFSPIMEELTGWHEAEVLGKHFNKVYSLPEMPGSDTQVINQPCLVYTRKEETITLPVRISSIKSANDPEKIDGSLALFITDPQANNVNKAQAEFVSTVSHELRTPITSIKGFASTLLNYKQGLPEEKKKKYISIIRDQAERLSRLVEDLLAVSRLESKKLQLTIQPIQIRSVTETIGMVIEAKYNGSHQINLNAPQKIPEVWGDPDRVEQILTNLIDNAFKYSPKADKVDVSISEDKLNDEHGDRKVVRIDITDYGIGIDPENVSKVFLKFSRLDHPLTRETEGTGLGLYISKSLAQLLHGDLKVTSGEGKTTFSVYLPTESFNTEEIWWN